MAGRSFHFDVGVVLVIWSKKPVETERNVVVKRHSDSRNCPKKAKIVCVSEMSSMPRTPCSVEEKERKSGFVERFDCKKGKTKKRGKEKAKPKRGKTKQRETLSANRNNSRGNLKNRGPRIV